MKVERACREYREGPWGPRSRVLREDHYIRAVQGGPCSQEVRQDQASVDRAVDRLVGMGVGVVGVGVVVEHSMTACRWEHTWMGSCSHTE